MKRRIHFDLTVGSHWPHGDRPPEHIWEVTFPEGGEPSERTIEFEEVEEEEPFITACNVLKKEMAGESYHIWYWTWLDENSLS